MSDNTHIIKKYIENAKKFNTAEPGRDKRISLTYNPKLHKILMVEKEQFTEAPFYSDTKVYEILERRLARKLGKLSPEDRKQFILDHIEEFTFNHLSVAFLKTSVGSYLDEKTFKVIERSILLENIYTTPEMRNCGIGSMLINETKNEDLENNLESISGQIYPLDAKAYLKERKLDKINNYLAYNLGLLKKKSHVDIQSLTQIYDKLGFDVYKVLYSDLKMCSENNNFEEKDKLPSDIVTFSKKEHDDFFII